MSNEQAGFRRIPTFDDAFSAQTSGAQLSAIRKAAPRFRECFAGSGKPDYVGTFDLVSVPYPTRFGLFRGAPTLSPFVTMTNRLIVVRYKDFAGVSRTLLWEPSDAELGRNVRFYADLARKMPAFLDKLASKTFGTPLDHLRTLGIRPEEVDYLTFDHLHIQDVRRLVGTNKPASDLSPGAAVPAMFPNAKLLVQKKEWEILPELHPLQAPWYQPETYKDLRKDSVMQIEGDVLLGPGVALLLTPGHTPGNHTLVLNTDTGIWASSENAIATECLTPEHSGIKTLRKYGERNYLEVVINANTIETTAEQYNSVMKEKLIVDRSREDSRFLQFFPSAELTPAWMSPDVSPTFRHCRISHGSLQPVARGIRQAAE